VDKVQNVCANCHVFQAQMYEKSSHKAAFDALGLPGCVVCHSNHGIHLPSDAMLGTGPQGVCMRCHQPGDRCDQARVKIQSGLMQLDGAIKQADIGLSVAEASGMDVSEARLAQTQARDELIKARVTIHTYQAPLVDQDVQAGLKIAAKDQQAGKDAMVERNQRRIGLGICFLAIAIMLAGLWLFIRKIEH
jgi:predicted CXXCH cytochrome family protein